MKAHSLNFIFTWATFLVLFEPYHDMTESCFHDDQHQDGMRNTSVVMPHLDDIDDGGKPRRMRRLAPDVYKPLRITTIYSLEHLLDDEQEALKRVMERAVRKIASILSVIRKDGLLLLPRSPCPVVFREGINKGKCTATQNRYTGEYCLDGFQIPSAHLEGFAVYNRTHPDPVKVYTENGPGLMDTDYVLYVTSQMTYLCNPFKSSALAYAAYCKLDSTSRPLAGQVNFCPRTVKTQKFDEELLYKAAVHELFHALGFSNKLFEKFRKCNAGVCESWPQPMLKPVDGTVRLVTGAVIREMRKHFNCTSEPDFGGPLHVEYGKVTSHWDPMLMHSSVMGSTEQKPYQTLIDPISLAVFEDSGWYKVNYSQADKFIWGQGQGCSFGLSNFCKQQEGFCLTNTTGCHHLRLSKARCNINTRNPSACGVFAADQKPCFLTPMNGTVLDSETFSSSSRCFLSSLEPANLITSEKNSSLELMGRCYETRCEDNKYYVRVLNGEWQLCIPESHIQVEGYIGSVLCASYQAICLDFIHPEPSTDPVTSTSTTTEANFFSTRQDSTTSWKRQHVSFITSNHIRNSTDHYFSQGSEQTVENPTNVDVEGKGKSPNFSSKKVSNETSRIMRVTGPEDPSHKGLSVTEDPSHKHLSVTDYPLYKDLSLRGFPRYKDLSFTEDPPHKDLLVTEDSPHKHL